MGKFGRDNQYQNGAVGHRCSNNGSTITGQLSWEKRYVDYLDCAPIGQC